MYDWCVYVHLCVRQIEMCLICLNGGGVQTMPQISACLMSESWEEEHSLLICNLSTPHPHTHMHKCAILPECIALTPLTLQIICKTAQQFSSLGVSSSEIGRKVLCGKNKKRQKHGAELTQYMKRTFKHLKTSASSATFVLFKLCLDFSFSCFLYGCRWSMM